MNSKRRRIRNGLRAEASSSFLQTLNAWLCSQLESGPQLISTTEPASLESIRELHDLLDTGTWSSEAAEAILNNLKSDLIPDVGIGIANRHTSEYEDAMSKGFLCISMLPVLLKAFEINSSLRNNIFDQFLSRIDSICLWMRVVLNTTTLQNILCPFSQEQERWTYSWHVELILNIADADDRIRPSLMTSSTFFGPFSRLWTARDVKSQLLWFPDRPNDCLIVRMLLRITMDDHLANTFCQYLSDSDGQLSQDFVDGVVRRTRLIEHAATKNLPLNKAYKAFESMCFIIQAFFSDIRLRVIFLRAHCLTLMSSGLRTMLSLSLTSGRSLSKVPVQPLAAIYECLFRTNAWTIGSWRDLVAEDFLASVVRVLPLLDGNDDHMSIGRILLRELRMYTLYPSVLTSHSLFTGCQTPVIEDPKARDIWTSFENSLEERAYVIGICGIET